MWPSYMTNVTPTVHCLKQLDKVYGQKTPIRIGGTTQDRALYGKCPSPKSCVWSSWTNFHLSLSSRFAYLRIQTPISTAMSITMSPVLSILL